MPKSMVAALDKHIEPTSRQSWIKAMVANEVGFDLQTYESLEAEQNKLARTLEYAVRDRDQKSEEEIRARIAQIQTEMAEKFGGGE